MNELETEVVGLLARAVIKLAPDMWHHLGGYGSNRFYLEFHKDFKIELYESTATGWCLSDMYVKRKNWLENALCGREHIGLPPLEVGSAMTSIINDYLAGKELKSQVDTANYHREALERLRDILKELAK